MDGRPARDICGCGAIYSTCYGRECKACRTVRAHLRAFLDAHPNNVTWALWEIGLGERPELATPVREHIIARRAG